MSTSAFGRASNFWQSDVFWRHPARPFCWTWHQWTTHNHLRPRDVRQICHCPDGW